MNRTWDKRLFTSEQLELIKRYDELMDRLDEAIIKKEKKK